MATPGQEFAVEMNRFRTVNTKDSPVTMEEDELPLLINLMPIGTSLFSIPGFSASPLVTIGDQEAARPQNTAVVALLTVVKGLTTGTIYVCTASGTTANTADPSAGWSTTNPVTDGGATWTPFDSTILRFADVNLNNQIYKIVATKGGALYIVTPEWVQFRLNVPAAGGFTNPQFEQWKYTNALIIDPTAGYWDFDGQPGPDRAPTLAIGTDTKKVKITNAINYVAGTTQKTQAAADLWGFTGFDVAINKSRSAYLYLDSSGVASIAAGTAGATDLAGADALLPAKDLTKSLIGRINVTAGATAFTGGTTAMNGATITTTYTDNIMLLHHTTLSTPSVGSCIAIWKGRVWIGNGRTIHFSAPDSFTDFQTASSGGTVIDGYPSLRNQINALVGAQDYLYVVGDHATHVISGLQIFNNTSTIFNLTDAIPGVGSPYPDTVKALGPMILAMSNTGINGINAGSYELLSSYLDGTIPSVDTTFSPVACFSKIFSKLCFSVLVKCAHPVDGSLQKMILCYYEERWFYVFYGQDFTFIAQSATATDTFTYASVGNTIIQIFTGESYCMKKIRIKALNMQAAFNDKQVLEVGATLVNSTGLLTDIIANMTVIGSGWQSESSQGSALVTFSPGTIIWLNDSGAIVPWNANWIRLYSDMLGMAGVEARGKRIQVDFEESSAAAYSITGIMASGIYGALN